MARSHGLDLAFTLLVGGISYIAVTLHYMDTNYLQRLTTDPQHIQRRNDVGDDNAGMWPTSTVRTI